MPNKRYGIPYKGGKSRIVEKLVCAIPYKGVDNFYDLFAGGCAVTHKMILDGKYKHYYANDIDGQGIELFVNAVNGKYKNERRWISRDMFFSLKDNDPYVSLCWSFGNNQRHYLYSKTIEPYKKACHCAIVFDDFSLFRELCPEVTEACQEALKGITDIHERRVKFGPTVVKWLKAYGTADMVAKNPLYNSCHKKKDTRLQRLESLESDYREVQIKPNSVIYCDPPYKGTDKYGRNKMIAFDYDTFYDWCCEQSELVLISEYDMPNDRFESVWGLKHIQSLCATKTSEVTERLFVPKHQVEKYYEMIGLQNNSLLRNILL